MCLRAGTRGKAEGADRGSISTPVRLRWRAEQKLGGGESFDDMHGSTADGAVPEGVRMIRCSRCWRS